MVLRWEKLGKNYRPGMVAELFYADGIEGRYVVQREKRARNWRFKTPRRGGGTMPSFDDAKAHCQSVEDATAMLNPSDERVMS